MNQLLNNRVGKKQKSQKRGCLFLILGSLLALLATGGFILVVSLLTGRVIEARHGGEVAYALMTATKGCYVAAMLCFYGILAVWYISPTAGELRQRRSRVTAAGGRAEDVQSLSRRTLLLITAGLLCGVILAGAVCVNTYSIVDREGIRTYCFAETGRYEWKQAKAYRIDCEDDGGLAMTFTMRDGKQYEILQGVNSATAAFREEFSSVTHFATAVDDIMIGLQVPRNVRHYERAVKFYKNDYPELWPYVSQLIGYRDLNAAPEETVPETEAETSATSE